MVKVLDSSLEITSNANYALTFTFELIPLVKLGTTAVLLQGFLWH